MTNQEFADDLEKEIILMYQELCLKRRLLNECREKLQDEISMHKETKCSETKYLYENKELKIQLEISTKAAKKLEEENNKTRELLVKLQVQVDTYMNERQSLADKCYQLETQNTSMKNEIFDLKEKLKSHVLLEENYKIRQSESVQLLNEVVRKQEILNKEQNRLMAVCNEGLQFANKVSEEAKFQAKYVQEANASQRKMEEKMIRLLAVTAELQKANKKVPPNEFQQKEESYTAEFISQQERMKTRIQELIEENKKLTDELNFSTKQTELLLQQVMRN